MYSNKADDVSLASLTSDATVCVAYAVLPCLPPLHSVATVFEEATLLDIASAPHRSREFAHGLRPDIECGAAGALSLDMPATKRKAEELRQPVVIDDSDNDMEVDRVQRSSAPGGSKLFNEHVRIFADLYGSADAEPLCRFSKGDSDGMIEVKIPPPAGSKRALRLTLMCTNIDDYPYGKSRMSTWTDDDVSDDVNNKLELLSEQGALTLEQALRFVLQKVCNRNLTSMASAGARLARNGQRSPGKSASMATIDGEEDDEDDDDPEHDLFGLGDLAGAHNGLDQATKAALRKDIRAILKVTSWTPGLCRTGDHKSYFSVGVPISSLDVPARALNAWDLKLCADDEMYLVLLCEYTKYPPDPSRVRFKVGLSPKHKPSHEAILAAFRDHSSSSHFTADEFEDFALASPLTEVMNSMFPQALALRLQYKLGWAGAEQHLVSHAHASGSTIDKRACQDADTVEKAAKAEGEVKLPRDPLLDAHNVSNLPLVAFSYLVRRFVMSPRWCLICKRVVEGVTSIRPFVCDNDLCLFQYLTLGLGPSVEYEILHNGATVDLLIILAYAACKEGELRDRETPKGVGLRIPADRHVGDVTHATALVPFDDVSREVGLQGLCAMIQEIPPVADMAAWLRGDGMTLEEQRSGRMRKLSDVKGGAIPLPVFDVLRWIVASNTSYLREIEEPQQMVQGVPAQTYRQFLFVSGSPEKETKLRLAIEEEKQNNVNCRQYPTLFAWHGSGLRNWHSIIRIGLHFQKTSNGRAFGNGIYCSPQGDLSLGHYSQQANPASQWKNGAAQIARVAALCEIVNAPERFVSKSPHLVVDKLAWIQTRVLVVQRSLTADEPIDVRPAKSAVQTLSLDPRYRLTLQNKDLRIPDWAGTLQRRRSSIGLANMVACLNDSDEEFLKSSDDESDIVEVVSSTKGKAINIDEDPYVPFAPTKAELIRDMPQPGSATPNATMSIQRELKTCMKLLKDEGPRSLGWYMEAPEDNMYQWIVELFGFETFDPDMPLVNDMKRHDVPGVLLEVNFSSNHPFSPPFIRVIWPRFLPFMSGGGGHITGGGSICMDLLTSSGWIATYSLDAVLLQIKMAICNPLPKPARLAAGNEWNRPYGVQEAIEGFRRAAATHSWIVPKDLEAMAHGR